MSNSNYPQAQDGAVSLLPYLVDTGIVKTCINCEHFTGADEQGYCEIAKQPPPPRVIFYGCPAWELEIPF